MEQDTQPLCTEIPAADLSSVTDLHFWDPDHEASTENSQPATIEEHPSRSKGHCFPYKDIEAQMIENRVVSLEIGHTVIPFPPATRFG